MARRLVLPSVLVVLATALVACGSQGTELDEGESADIRAGAEIFTNKCASCHTLDAVGSEGSAVNVRDRERIDGPNFNTRVEETEQVLYAIRNGGFSGALMPENIVTGEEARQVAEFVAKYAGRSAAGVGPEGS